MPKTVTAIYSDEGSVEKNSDLGYSRQSPCKCWCEKVLGSVEGIESKAEALVKLLPSGYLSLTVPVGTSVEDLDKTVTAVFIRRELIVRKSFHGP